jgi:hypothetical protein
MAELHRIDGPAWLIVPDVGDPQPSHPIVLPPDVEEPGDERPSHPIYFPDLKPDNSLPGPQPSPEHPIFLPGGPVDPDWGISIERPDNTLPGDLPRPDQGLPGDQPHPDQGLPGDQPYPDNSLPGFQPFPEHPIFFPPYPDNSLPPYVDNELPGGGEPEVGELSFYQRKTIGINWDPNFDPAVTVAIYVVDGETTSKVRTVPNNGASSVTFPQDFTGERTFRVAGSQSYCEGTVTVK